MPWFEGRSKAVDGWGALARSEAGRVKSIAKFIRLGPQMETRMAQIISLLDRQSRMPRRVLKEPVEAKILLYTGVRYERLDLNSHHPGTGSKRVKGK